MSESTDGTVSWAELMASIAETIGDRVAAKWLCEHASGAESAAEFDAMRHDLVSARAGLHLDAMARRLLGGEPLQYVMGRWAFRRLDLLVDRRVLIPRADTETLVEVALQSLATRRTTREEPAVVADLGTGSGAVGLALLDESPLGSLTVWMTDASQDALDVARANAAGLGRRGGGARFALGSWFDALPAELRGSFDVIVSNPPYIAVGDVEVDEQVRTWEPHDALFAGADGLDAVRTIVSGARDWLTPGGALALEIGHTQAGAVSELMREAGFVDVNVRRDAAGRERVVVSRASGE
ncbi:MAG: peptide chain release factor N(5)-glutamine methyltransferase [Ilumatobacteraceae bacterium]